jgi:hypothetical protein
MQVTRSILLVASGAVAGIAFVLSCGDNLSIRADAAVDAPKAPDASPLCDCPAAEPPLAGRVVVISTDNTVDPNAESTGTATCPVGSQLISGSCTTIYPTDIYDVIMRESGFYISSPLTWHCLFLNKSSFRLTFRTSVICLKPMP